MNTSPDPDFAADAGAPAPAASTSPDSNVGAATPAHSPTDSARPDAPGAGTGMLVLGSPTTPTPAPEATQPRVACVECGDGHYDADGYCETCGAKAADPRDHEESAPAPWVAGVCDRGVRHRTNEDALAVYALHEPDHDATGRADVTGRVAALVVCDGVSTARNSAQASRAAADAAVEVLRSVTAADTAHLADRLDDAADAAARAVADMTGEPTPDAGDTPFSTNPSCTFVAAVLVDDTAVIGAVGDSRGYWFPDAGAPTRLTTDDSWAEEQIRLGADRASAESGPQAHTITRWLGVDAPDHTPGKTTLRLDAPGWLMICSDGLWNYASEPAQLADVVNDALATLESAPADTDTEPLPLRLSRALVDWANAQGGRDNITVALARIDAPSAADTATTLDDQDTPHA